MRRQKPHISHMSLRRLQRITVLSAMTGCWQNTVVQTH